MIAQLIHNEFGALLTILLTVGFQDFVRVPNDRTGVGAAGKIGRGTAPGERFLPRPMPSQAAPTWSYVTTPMPAQAAPVWAYPAPAAPAVAAPAQSNINRSENADPVVDLPALTRSNPYLAYHRGWVQGYWMARLPRSRSRTAPGSAGREAGARRASLSGLGMGIGWGLPAWLIGPMAYRWGYFPYDNPFDRGGTSLGAEGTRVDDYSRPISILNPPPTERLLNEALVTFRQARDAFRLEDYRRALQLTDESLRLMPEDPLLHQFRALVLFALLRYEESAAGLYAVLAIGPGWDWATMVDLYGDREAYTRQLRLLESYSEENPRSLAARFVRAYHYYTTGYAEEALGQWNQIVALRPNEGLSVQFLLELQPSLPSAGDREALIPTLSGATRANAAAAQGRPGKLEGTWIALPRPDTTIVLTFQPNGHIVWKVGQPGRDRGFEGYAIYERKALILSQDEDNILVGTIRWQDDGHFLFKAMADRPGNSGLTFTKAP